MPHNPGGTFSEADIARILATTALRDVTLFAETDSTNDRGLEHAQDPWRETPFLVLAERQTAGRGRGANRWWSADGALAFSLVVDLNNFPLPLERWPEASLVMGLAVRSSLARAAPGSHFGLKWPNDVHVCGRKVSGILAETAPKTVGRMVIGVGINVNNSLADAPAEVAAQAISLLDAIGHRADRVGLLIDAINEFGERLEALATDPAALADEWHRHCLLRGRAVELRAGERLIAGRCRGIDPRGALLIETAHGVEPFVGGIVERVRATPAG
jgi:BirA family biotin operon repressor/biotin-[acetyl-CoA-carboxylase] ligase